MTKRQWRDLTPMQRRVIEAAGTVQVLLAVIAWVDLALRPGERVRGPKWRWALIITVNFVGPVAYLRWGRQAPRQRRILSPM